MKILLCGGGNAIHVLTSYIGSGKSSESGTPSAGVEVSILSLYPGEADKLRRVIPDERGIQCTNDLPGDSGGVCYGKPVQVTDDPAAVVPDADVVILALPSFAHEQYLTAIKPHLKKAGVVIGSMPGQSGFDLIVRHILGGDFVEHSASLFAMETLPWACRIVEYGKKVQVLGTKSEIGMVIATPPSQSGQDMESVRRMLQALIGPKPVLKASGNFLAVTIGNPNVVHPTISYGFYRNKDLSIPFDEPPVFYQGVDEPTGEMLSKVSDEVLELRNVLTTKYSLDLSGVLHLRDILLRYYGDEIGDKTNVSTMLQTSNAHRGLCHPMREIEAGSTIKYLPNFQYRYFTEDLPCGMIVIRGIAELAHVETPMLDEVILWCQKQMNQEFLVNGKLTGKDLNLTRCPQVYGYNNLDAFMKANHYIEDDE